MFDVSGYQVLEAENLTWGFSFAANEVLGPDTAAVWCPITSLISLLKMFAINLSEVMISQFL